MVMSTAAVLVRYGDPLDVRERGAVVGFLAGYTGTTRVSCTTDLRLSTVWLHRDRCPTTGRQARHLELFAGQMETTVGCARPSPAGSRPRGVSTGTAMSKNSSNVTRPRTFVARRLTTSHAYSAATNSAGCLSWPARFATRPCSYCAARYERIVDRRGTRRRHQPARHGPRPSNAQDRA